VYSKYGFEFIRPRTGKYIVGASNTCTTKQSDGNPLGDGVNVGVNVGVTVGVCVGVSVGV
jgi:hypothetical protein